MKVNRLVSIIILLLDKKRISAQELAETFEVSPRTIYRDIDAINLAGIPIRSTPGVGGGFEIMKNYKLDNKVLSSSDISAILTGLSSFSNMLHQDSLAHTLAKIKSFIPADHAQEIELRTNQIQIDLSPWMVNPNIQADLKIIQQALTENRELSFDYIDRHGNKSNRTAEPYQLVLKGNHWYWQGYCLKRNDYRLFKIVRMSNLKLSEQSFTPKNYQNPVLDFTDILSTIQTNIKLRIHRSVMDQVLEYCPFENFSSDGEDHYLVNFPFIENDFYYNILFSFGSHCECIEPLQVRNEIKKRINQLADLYRN
ncbi:YafY family transcriptional regulator [Enterococcus sp. ALS3]|uniref:YafY family transcriptional regulator n=1 Tax=Enterococcus alishanensis TaxID=1303817 RepID=A0ABS6TC73_9ENTE|nr:YafY family protein [Enterococcus alishanensis]MBV7390505.1 YafY family transcriptional regulator [Enterococcus alishanensis]